MVNKGKKLDILYAIVHRVSRKSTLNFAHHLICMHFISCFSFEFSLFEGLSVELFENDMIHFKIEIIYTVILIEKCKYDYLYKMYVQEKVHNIITIDI